MDMVPITEYVKEYAKLTPMSTLNGPLVSLILAVALMSTSADAATQKGKLLVPTYIAPHPQKELHAYLVLGKLEGLKAM